MGNDKGVVMEQKLCFICCRKAPPPPQLISFWQVLTTIRVNIQKCPLALELKLYALKLSKAKQKL